MKLYGQDGKGTGKLGSSVYVINHGLQIKREYNGTIANPSTNLQVAQRSRFKLASQVSASLENVIAIPRKGILSPRNRFVQKNMPYFYGNVNGAQVTYENLQLTLGSVGLPAIRAERGVSDNLLLQMDCPVGEMVSHVVYNVYRKTEENMLQFEHSEVVATAPANGQAEIDFPVSPGELLIFAYGFKARNARARARYGSYQITDGADVAYLVANRKMEISDYMFTATRGTTLGADDESSPLPGVDDVLLYVTAMYGVSIEVVIDGSTQGVFTDAYFSVRKGSTVTMTARVQEGWQFDGWAENGQQGTFSGGNPLEFDIDRMRDIVAISSPKGLE